MARFMEGEKERGSSYMLHRGADAYTHIHTHTCIKAGVATLSPSFPGADTVVAVFGVGRRPVTHSEEVKLSQSRENEGTAYPRIKISFIPWQEETR